MRSESEPPLVDLFSAEDRQPVPVETRESWRSEWVGMPEFVQERQREYAKITVRFRCQADLDDFARLIGQRLNARSQCTWHPELPPVGSSPTVLRYVNEP